MTYDEAISQIEHIVKELEAAEALSLTEYKSKAGQVTKLLTYCEEQLKIFEQKINE